MKGTKETIYCRRKGIIGVLCVMAGCGAPPSPDPPPDTVPPAEFAFAEDQDPAIAALAFVATELLVQPYPGADAQTLHALYDHTGATVVDDMAEIDVTVLGVAPERLSSTAAELTASGLIETVHKNYLYQPDAVPNDPLFSREDHLAQIRAAQAWDVSVGVAGVPIAIVDTGVDPNHPDLADKIIDGWNIYDGNADFADVLGHGTLVAGVAAAASNNGLGVAGVAWDCPILAVRVGNADGQSTGRHIAAGILWAVAHGARVINVSFAPLWSDRIVRSAAQQAFNRGCVVVISSGNAGGTNTAVGYDEALFVGAVNPTNQIASFSDRGPFVDLVAPGTGIRSTTRGGDYGMANGTSFSAPIVSGVVALAWSVQPDLRPVSIQDVLLRSAVDLGDPGKDTTYGAGAVDAAAAVTLASQTPAIADTTPPTLRVIRPATRETLSGRYTASVEATDASGVADVVLSIDTVPFATDTRAPYQFVIDTATFSSGSHTIAFVATDVAGNPSTARNVTVTFSPSSSSTSGVSSNGIVFRSPTAGATVSGDVTIQATVSDPDGLAVVEWFIDGVSVFVSPVSGVSTGVSYLWKASAATPGRHTVSITITDAVGSKASGSLILTRP
jgi:subtilisin family serine protease